MSAPYPTEAEYLRDERAAIYQHYAGMSRDAADARADEDHKP